MAKIAQVMSVAQLVTILQEMDKAPSQYGHQDADTILCRAIELLAARLGDEELARKLIAAYDAIEKWYA